MSNYNTQLQSNNTDLQTVLQTLQNKAAGGGVEQATPEISVNSSTGLITATAGTKSSTYQLAFQEATTITPTTANQTIASGTYLTGTQTIEGDSNLVASNIKSGVSIFGVSGTLEEGDIVETVVDDVSKAIIERTITEISDDSIEVIGMYAFANCYSLTAASFPAVTTIGMSAFANCYSLTAASFPAVTTIGTSAFANCSRLTTISFPNATTIGYNAFWYCPSLTTASFPAATTIENYAFYYCRRLTTASFPAATTIGCDAFRSCHSLTTASFPAATTISYNAFYYCSSLTAASFPAVRTIGSNAFYYCSRLTSLYLTGSSIPTLSHINAFYSTPMSVSTYTGSFGSIFVPASLVSSYKAATNWATYADRITAIE